MDMTLKEPLNILILAAGKGTRMHSQLPKVMHALGGFPLIDHAILRARDLNPDQLIVLIAPDQDILKSHLEKNFPQVNIAYQTEQLGTGHAVSSALEQLPMTGHLLVTFGDTPLVTEEALKTLHDNLVGADISLAAMDLEDGAAYGRICQDARGHVTKIVEFKHASAAEKVITRVNGGFMGLNLSTVAPLLAKLPHHGETGEYYLTDLVELAAAQRLSTRLAILDPMACAGVNTKSDLAYLEGVFQNNRRAYFLNKGVTLLDPQSVYFSLDTAIEPDAIIEPNVFFGPKVMVAQGAHIKAFSHIEGATVGPHAVVGPFARLRPGTHLESKAKVGNFVEIKNSHLGQGSKVNHLSYIGDATLGTGVNVGAGTITCNYDGTNKWHTTIEDGVFIGSHATLIAPLTIQANSFIGAGSTLNQTVPENGLAISRSPLKIIENGAKRLRQKNAAKKKEKESPTCAA